MLGSLSIPDTVDRWTVTVEPQIEAVTTDSQGTIDYTLGALPFLRSQAFCRGRAG